jgi:crossover junction endodeoxyribonuclease RuvC
VITFGIDPGQTGAIAMLDERGDLLSVIDMPIVAGSVNTHQLRDYLSTSHLGDRRIILEALGTRPGQNLTAVKTSCINWGKVAACCDRYPLHIVTSATWSKTVGRPKLDLKARKEWSRKRAIELWPDAAGLFARAMDDGRAEAALIAWSWIRTVTAYVINPSAIGNPNETPIVRLPAPDVDSYAGPLLDELDDLLADLADVIHPADPTAFYRNKIAEARRTIADWFEGDYL